MDITKLKNKIMEIGFDFEKKSDLKFIIGKKQINEDIPGLVGFKNAFWIVLENDRIKIEYFKGQIFMEIFFENQNDCLDFIKENFIQEIY